MPLSSAYWYVSNLEDCPDVLESDRFIKTNGTGVVNGNFQVDFAAPRIAESLNCALNKFSPQAHSSELWNDSDILNGALDGIEPKALNGTDGHFGFAIEIGYG